MKYNRHSIRLNNFDYSNNGYYFVTICANWKGNVFGKIDIVGARRDAPIINKNKSPLINENNNSLIINKNINNNLFKTKLNNNFIDIKSNNNETKINNNSSIMKLNQNGKIIENVWKTLPKHHNVILDEFIIMPDHVHFILIIKNINNTEGASRRAPTQLGFVIGMFKTECTKQINKLNKTPGIQIFQRNYFDRIIRNEKEYLKIKKYIKDNPDNSNL